MKWCGYEEKNIRHLISGQFSNGHAKWHAKCGNSISRPAFISHTHGIQVEEDKGQRWTDKLSRNTGVQDTTDRLMCFYKQIVSFQYLM